MIADFRAMVRHAIPSHRAIDEPRESSEAEYGAEELALFVTRSHAIATFRETVGKMDRGGQVMQHHRLIAFKADQWTRVVGKRVKRINRSGVVEIFTVRPNDAQRSGHGRLGEQSDIDGRLIQRWQVLVRSVDKDGFDTHLRWVGGEAQQPDSLRRFLWSEVPGVYHPSVRLGEAFLWQEHEVEHDDCRRVWTFRFKAQTRISTDASHGKEFARRALDAVDTTEEP
jgi:hypothetical protein